MKPKEMQRQKKSKVVLVPCPDYDKERVYRAMRTGLRELGGLKALIGPDERILVKPNFLTAAPPERAVTTHPAVIESMFRILCEDGYARVSYGDSPGHGSCEGAAKKLDLSFAAEKYGISRANMEEEVQTPFPEGRTAKSFSFAKGITEADAIISLCKMKTHQLERVTGAVKNVYGFICGARKAAGHVKYPNASIFARMLADIHRCTDIRLHIMDGIVAMEGNGPGSGDPTPMKVLLFSQDPVAMDTVFCRLIHLDPRLVPTCVQGQAMGIGTDNMREIELVEAAPGEEGAAQERVLTETELMQAYGNPDFDVERSGKPQGFLGEISQVVSHFARRPVIKENLCIRCGVCVSHCPVPGGAVTFANGKGHPPVYDYKKCIRCYCCQEMCPRHAITVGRR